MGSFENLKGVDSKLESLGDDQRKKLMEYLKSSSDSAIGENLEEADQEEIEMAVKLLNLDLPSADSEPSRHQKFNDSNYKLDIEKREEVFRDLGIDPDENEIVRHNIVIQNEKEEGLHLKVINLMRKTENPEDEEKTDADKKEMIEDGTIFLGVINFEEGEPVYANLDEKDKEFIKDYLKNK